jgi:(p)ppGpp synthase/HD superfamily hydrolase
MRRGVALEAGHLAAQDLGFEFPVDVLIDLEVYDLKHLTAILAQLRAKPMVAKAERVNG